MADDAAAPVAKPKGADAAPSPAAKSKKTKAKGEKKTKEAPSHPVYGAMIKAAINELKDRKGATKQAISKFIQQKYKLGDNEKKINAHLKMALKRGVSGGTLTQATGTGAAGRFRLADKAEGAAKAKPKVAKKPKPAGSPKKAAAKPKKAAKMKAKSPKKPKSPKKSAKTLSPKKTIKKAAKPKSPKKPAVKKAAPKA